MNELARFTNKVAVITGAGGGIPLASAMIMAREGATIIGLDRSADALESRLKPAIASLGATVATFAIDVLDEAAVARAIGEITDRFSRIDVLVNGVGGSTAISNPARPIEEMSLQDWETLVALNMRGTFLVSRAVVKVMKPARYGKIVNMSSFSASGGGGLSIAYSASKGGVSSFTKKLAIELAPFGITCNEIAPNRTLTERVVEKFAYESDDERRELIARVPLGRFSTAEDQARVVCFLASRDSDYVTGATIEVTGGQRY